MLSLHLANRVTVFCIKFSYCNSYLVKSIVIYSSQRNCFIQIHCSSQSKLDQNNIQSIPDLIVHTVFSAARDFSLSAG